MNLNPSIEVFLGKPISESRNDDAKGFVRSPHVPVFMQEMILNDALQVFVALITMFLRHVHSVLLIF